MTEQASGSRKMDIEVAKASRRGRERQKQRISYVLRTALDPND
jgi:hypothetical protein